MSQHLQGYALIEYEKRSQADEAIREASGTTLLDQTIQCDYAFVKPTAQQQCVLILDLKRSYALWTQSDLIFATDNPSQKQNNDVAAQRARQKRLWSRESTNGATEWLLNTYANFLPY